MSLGPPMCTCSMSTAPCPRHGMYGELIENELEQLRKYREALQKIVENETFCYDGRPTCSREIAERALEEDQVDGKTLLSRLRGGAGPAT